jgi:hypothetical protein
MSYGGDQREGPAAMSRGAMSFDEGHKLIVEVEGIREKEREEL